METAERRHEILKILCRRRYEKMENLAAELGVSARTVQRDVESLSLSYPLYTKTGRYEGGVYLLDTYSMDRMYMNEREINVLKKAVDFLANQTEILTQEDKQVLYSVISEYSKPVVQEKQR